MPNRKSISYGSKVIAKVKVDNRQTNRQDKNNMPPIIRSGGIKIIATHRTNVSHVKYNIPGSKVVVKVKGFFFFLPQIHSQDKN